MSRAHAVDWSTLTIIGGSLGLGQAMQASGMAAVLVFPIATAMPS